MNIFKRIDPQIYLFLLILLVACASNINPSQNKLDNNSTQPTEITITLETKDNLEKLAADYRSLRKIKGQFEGGNWIDDVDSSSGRKHTLMVELEELIVAKDTTRSQLIELLGKPDINPRKSDQYYSWILNSAEFKFPKVDDYQLAIYFWRGAHDFLYFVLQQDTVIGSGWIHLLE